MNKLLLAVVMVLALAGQAAASFVAVQETAVYDWLDDNYYFSVEFNQDYQANHIFQYLVKNDDSGPFWWLDTDRVIRGGEMWTLGNIPVRNPHEKSSLSWGTTVFEADYVLGGDRVEFVIPASAFEGVKRISYKLTTYEDGRNEISNWGKSGSRNAPVPEPSTLLMLLPALGGLAVRRWV